jgi:serine/threonine-protein kinase RsbW
MGVAGSNRRGGGAGSSPAAGSFRVTIPSDFASGRDVQERIMADVIRHGFGTDTTFAIRIALEEAMVNAIKHGNRLDPSKKVRVECKVTPRRAEITIEDEGPGFDRAAIPDPTQDENLDKPSGRGILLIESYMDGVQWSRGGRRLRMVKDNQP